MEAVRYSGLNPLATCFVPLSMKTSCKTEKPHSKEKDENASFKGMNEESNITKFTASDLKEMCLKKLHFEEVDVFQPCRTRSIILDSKNSASKLINENMYFTKLGFNSNPVKESSIIYWGETDITVFFRLLLVALYGFHTDKKSSITYDVTGYEETHVEENSVIEDGCSCPPMFGCTVPPDFFGNPFRLNSTCENKTVHVCDYSKVDKSGISSNCLASHCNTLKNEPLKDVKKMTKLEQYSQEFEEIVKDVCEMISLDTDDDVEKNSLCDGDMDSTPEFNRTVGDIGTKTRRESLKVNSTKLGISEESHVFDREDLVLEKEIPKDLIDDDIHPLLVERISMEKDEGVSPVIKEMIGRSFSPTYEQILSDPQELSVKEICNPPCSEWCDSLPQASKDNFRKFMNNLPELSRDLNSPKLRNSQILGRTFNQQRPFNKRSFSEGNSIKQKKNLLYVQSILDLGYKPKTLLHGRASYPEFDQPSHGVNDKYRCQSENFPHTSYENVPNFKKKVNRTFTWGPFDSADSLWKPLPDCLSAIERNPAQNAPKRVHELKRQMSLT